MSKEEEGKKEDSLNFFQLTGILFFLILMYYVGFWYSIASLIIYSLIMEYLTDIALALLPILLFVEIVWYFVQDKNFINFAISTWYIVVAILSCVSVVSPSKIYEEIPEDDA